MSLQRRNTGKVFSLGSYTIDETKSLHRQSEQVQAQYNPSHTIASIQDRHSVKQSGVSTQVQNKVHSTTLNVPEKYRQGSRFNIRLLLHAILLIFFFLTGGLESPVNYMSSGYVDLQQGYIYRKATCMSTVVKFDRSLSTGCLKLMINLQERVEAYSRNSQFPAEKQNRYRKRTDVHKRQDKSESKVWIHIGIVSPLMIHIPNNPHL